MITAKLCTEGGSVGDTKMDVIVIHAGNGNVLVDVIVDIEN